MFGIENYWGFLIAGIILNITPGSNTIYILTRSIAQGRRAGIYSVLGVLTGGLIHTLFSAFGLSLILSTSATVFNMVKYAGAGYLIYLGIRMIMDRANFLEPNTASFERHQLKQIYWQGIVNSVLNPKVALFFLSFLPQFIDPYQSHGPAPFLILGATFITTGTFWCFFLACASAAISRLLRGNAMIGKRLQKMSGIIFVGLGLKMALQKQS